ncbi:MAG: hypothetical protein IPM82_16740 [Saprospiraceae bacterium]|nr:hypothetical protein [Saprospiraceae bacterium]
MACCFPWAASISSYVAGEAIDAPRHRAGAMFLGVLIVTSMYLLVNVAYMLLRSMPSQVPARWRGCHCHARAVGR